MNNNILYVNIKEILSRLLRHPLLLSLDLEAVILYTIDFIGIFGLPCMYEDKEATIPIEKFRGILPCDLISINQVMDTCSGMCLRSMTDTFLPTKDGHSRELTFKSRGRILFTSFENGEVKVSYKAIPTDDEGLPLLIDNSPYLRALEAFIKKEVFTIKFDLGQLNERVLLNTQQEYAWRAGQLQSEFTIPSESEMQSIMSEWCTLIQRTTDFDNGWRDLGNRENLRVH